MCQICDKYVLNVIAFRFNMALSVFTSIWPLWLMDKRLDSEILSLTTLCSIFCLLLYQYGKTKLASDKADWLH